MDKISIRLNNYPDSFNEEFADYLKSREGVFDASIDRGNYEVYVEYDSDIMDLSILKLEIINYTKLMKLPSIWGFNKYKDNSKEHIFKLDDICCEYCLANLIEDLLDNKGVISATHNYDINKRGVDITITYDPSLITEDDLKELDKHFDMYR